MGAESAPAEQYVRSIMVGPYPDDPYPVYGALRDAAPVYRSELGLWFASSYSDCLTILRDGRFGQGAGAQRLRDDDRFEASPAFKTLAFMLPFIDPPDHTRLRKLITRAFTPRAVERMRMYLETLCDRLFDEVRQSGGGDLMADVAHHIPVGVICEMLGAPHDHDRELVEWSDALVGAVHPMVDDAELVRADDGARDFRAFVSELIAARRAEPRDDLITALVHAESDGDLLTADELVSTVILFIGAGIENTKHFIGSCFHALLDDRDMAESLRRDPSLVPAFSEEVLRLEPPVQIAVPRLALADVELGGCAIPAGEQICVVVGAANRDPTVYARPDHLDMRRDDPANLSLATGPHLCAGAALARLEAHVAVERFVQGFADISMASPGPSFRTEGRPSLRGLASLPVTL
jgi:cytochrome P450